MRVGRIPVVVTVTLEDGSTQVTPGDDRPFDRITFERRFGRSWPPVSESDKELDEDGDPKVSLDTSDELFLFMAWVQIHRAEVASKALSVDAFDGWLASIVSAEFDFQVPEKAEPVDGEVSVPTVPAPSSGG